MLSYLHILSATLVSTVLLPMMPIPTQIPSVRPILTGPQIMVRCQQAYDNLQSYKATLSVQCKPDLKHPQFDLPRNYPEPVVLAHLVYARPGKIIVSGVLRTANPKKSLHFRLLCRDKLAWFSVRWETETEIIGDKEDQNTALTEAAGISLLSATYLPGIFLHCSGQPEGLKKPASVDDKVITATIAGRPCYGVQQPSRYFDPERYWVDQKTFLLIRVEDDDTEQTITETRVNTPIAAGTFSPPK